MKHIPYKTFNFDGEHFVAFPLEDYEDFMAVRDTDSEFQAYKRGEIEALSNEEMLELIEAPTPLAFWRKKRGLTQKDLANKIDISTSYVTMIEKGERIGQPIHYLRISEALNVPMDQLIVDIDPSPARL